MQLGSIRAALASRAPRTIRFRIVTLVLLILLPLLAIFGWVALNLGNARMAVIETNRASVAERITARSDLLVADAIGKLTGLAATTEPEQESIESLRPDARGLLSQREFGRIWVFDTAGATMVGSDVQNPARSGPGMERSVIERVMAGRVGVSTVHGKGLDKATFVIAVPITRAKKVVGGLAAEMSVRLLEWTSTSSDLADRWIAAIVDREGRYVARSKEADSFVGTLASEKVKAVANGAVSSGTIESVNREGTEVLTSFMRSELTGWTTAVAVPTDVVNAPLRRSALLVFLVGASALLLTLLAALAYARRISEPVRSLGRMASAIGSGKSISKANYALAELDEVRRAFEAATAEGAHLAALVASSGDAIMSMDLNGVIRTCNPAAEELFGYKAEELVGKPKSLLVPPDRLDEHRAQQAKVTSGESVRSETIRIHRNGTPIAVSVDAAPIRRPDGTIIGTSSILHDITERIAGEEHRQFLMREIAHRSKNQLAIIQAIASQTARSSGTKQQFLDQFKGRLQGLSASHDLLLKQDWRGAPLDELVRRQIEAFVDDRSSAVNIDGPPCMLTAAAAEAIGLAMHELATNSAKYGALSVPEGNVDVVWRLLDAKGAENERQWELIWRERRGPKVEPPSVTGFGTQVIKRMAAMAVSGTAELDYAETGLVWRLVFPETTMRPIKPEISPRAA